MRSGIVVLWLMVAVVAMADEPAKELPPWQRMLKGEEAKTAERLEKEASDARAAGDLVKWGDAVRELAKVRLAKQGRDHWQTVDALWRAAAVERVAAAGPELQAEYRKIPAWSSESRMHAGNGEFDEEEAGKRLKNRNRSRSRRFSESLLRTTPRLKVAEPSLDSQCFR